MLDTVDFNHVQHISFTQSRLTDAVSVILSELLSYEHPSKGREWRMCEIAVRFLTRERGEVAVEYRPDFRHFGFPEMLWQAKFSICVEKAVFLQQRHRVFR